MPPGKTHQPKKIIQPFVPVRPDERTALYSHDELYALASTDPRNELDELSEPSRFKKDIKKPGAHLEPKEGPPQGGSLLLTFLAGAAVGAVLVALTTSKSGPELRENLKDLACRATRKARDLADEAGGVWDDMKERIVLASDGFKDDVCDSVAELRVERQGSTTFFAKER